MRALASHAVARPDGVKRISLYLGDLTSMPPREAVDLLLISAFPNDYSPTPSSLIGALDRIGVSVDELSRCKELDLRQPFSAWISVDISTSHPHAGFSRILCFETIGDKSPPEAVGDVFRAILPFTLGDHPIRTLAMPVLVSGDQAYSTEVMFTAMFEAAHHWLAAGIPLDEIKIVVRELPVAERLCGLLAKLSEQRASRSRSQAITDGYHFFISYAHKDAAEVDVLLDSLKVRNPALRVFRDKLKLDVGQSWQAEIDEAIANCQRVVVVYSPAYLKSKVCLEEFNMARLRHRESERPVLTPVYLREAALPLYMRCLQFVDCREADASLLSAAAEHLGGLA